MGDSYDNALAESDFRPLQNRTQPPPHPRTHREHPPSRERGPYTTVKRVHPEYPPNRVNLRVNSEANPTARFGRRRPTVEMYVSRSLPTSLGIMDWEPTRASVNPLGEIEGYSEWEGFSLVWPVGGRPASYEGEPDAVVKRDIDGTSSCESHVLGGYLEGGISWARLPSMTAAADKAEWIWQQLQTDLDKEKSQPLLLAEDIISYYGPPFLTTQHKILVWQPVPGQSEMWGYEKKSDIPSKRSQRRKFISDYRRTQDRELSQVGYFPWDGNEVGAVVRYSYRSSPNKPWAFDILGGFWRGGVSWIGFSSVEAAAEKAEQVWQLLTKEVKVLADIPESVLLDIYITLNTSRETPARIAISGDITFVELKHQIAIALCKLLDDRHPLCDYHEFVNMTESTNLRPYLKRRVVERERYRLRWISQYESWQVNYSCFSDEGVKSFDQAFVTDIGAGSVRHHAR